MRFLDETRRFSAPDQQRFAEATGDFNPIHLDALAARRTQAGAPVVHGVHALLWALDALVAAGSIVAPFSSLDVRFQKFIYLDSEVRIRIVRDEPGALRFELVEGDTVCTSARLRFGTAARAAAPGPEAAIAEPVRPATLDLAHIAACSGRLPERPGAPAAALFPHAARLFGAGQVEALGRLSTLVGMVCPGLHSIFGGFSVERSTGGGAPGTGFAVRRVDERVRLVEIAVDAAGLAGTVTAFAAQPPVAPPAVRELRTVVRSDEFAGTTALVIGGSRGLGALTARLIAAGGGRVVITYAAGEPDARAVAEGIAPDAVRILRYDARSGAAAQLADLEWEVDQLYYFATTHIFRRKAADYVAARFAEHVAVYVDGFADVCGALRARSPRPLRVFYPSSSAVDERPRDLLEYGMAKAAGETLCAGMHRFLRDVRVVVERLPRVLTDQTATVIPLETRSALDVMLPLVRAMHAAG